MTRTIYSGRRTGKSTRLIIESSELGKPILVINALQAELLNEKAERMELKIPHPITVRQYMNDRVTRSVRRNGILVDEAQDVLEVLLNTQIDIMTVTREDTN